MRVRVRGLPYRGDEAYWRLGQIIPCDRFVEIEVSESELQALYGMPEIEVLPATESEQQSAPQPAFVGSRATSRRRRG